MSQNIQGAPTTSAAVASPVDSATAALPKTQPPTEGVYVAVRGGAETRSGELLLVEAYAVLWIILMGWLFMLWRKQSRIHARLDELEKVLDRADADAAGAGTKATSSGAANAKAQPKGGSLP